MSYSKYKTGLIFFVILFVLLAILERYLGETNTNKLTILFIASLSVSFSLFFFLLYAEKKLSAEDQKGKFAPSILLPIISYWLIFAAIAYPIGMAVTYKIWHSFTEKNIKWENYSEQLKSEANQNKSMANRLTAAKIYYICFGEEIFYLDEKNQNKLYSPDESAITERVEKIKTEREASNLKKFMLFSSIISFLSGIFVTLIYFRYRKVKRKLGAVP